MLEGVVIAGLFFVIFFLAAPALFPVTGGVGIVERGVQTKDLSNAKQIYLGLKLYAVEHNGRFPVAVRGGTQDLSNANEAYSNLVPDYIRNAGIFYLKDSAWTPAPPEAAKGGLKRKQGLAAGENQFAYVTHLTEESNPSFPLIVDGFAEGRPGVYTSDKNAKGGVWNGKQAIVIRVDGSGKVERVQSTDFKVYGDIGSGINADLFSSAPNWLSADQIPLNPAVK